MRDRSMRSGTKLAREIKLTDWSMVGNLSNRSSGVQKPRDICACLKRYLYSAKCRWIIKTHFWFILSRDTSVLLQNTPLAKFIRNHIRDSSGVFSISSVVKISMILLISSSSLKLYLNSLVYQRNISVSSC